VDTTGVKSSAGTLVGRRNFCICPNGQNMREHAVLPPGKLWNGDGMIDGPVPTDPIRIPLENVYDPPHPFKHPYIDITPEIQ
jgi:hypothetical protein